ncbi:MAG: T9SS type A sorting domain-containing protein [Bacteroidetes bacterium]|nr:T9SS type A sorting domain-containing protein [Bacteroidota bacterium]
MIKKSTLTLVAMATAGCITAQVQLPNPGFENLGNPSPGVSSEPTGWYSNKSGSSIAKLGPQTCFQDGTAKHSGSYSVRIETDSYFGTAVNGSATTGVVNAPSMTDKSQGYIGTINYTTSSDDRRYACAARPDSLVGWYLYTAGGSSEQAKVRVILHTGDYNDPETPVSSNHPDLSANKIGDALFVSAAGVNISNWTRFSVPFNYVSSSTPVYAMANMTSSYNQMTTTTGSKLWIDDLALIYNPTGAGIESYNNQNNAHVFYANKNLNVSFNNKAEATSTVIVYDLTGKVLVSKQVNENQNNVISLSDLTSGMYMYVISGTSSQKAGKFIVE